MSTGGESKKMSSLSQLHYPKQQSAKSIKVAHCQEADLGDWLQQARHSSLTWSFVIFLGLEATFTLCVRVQQILILIIILMLIPILIMLIFHDKYFQNGLKI